ncbi:HIT domain-containing protein [bacterium]|nr:HIT domain-containing protein [bacterium]
MSDCLFCNIVKGHIPAKRLFESESVLAFLDIDPKAPSHVLVIPKVHLANVIELSKYAPSLSFELMDAIGSIASTLNLTSGFRIVSNTGDDGGQTVHHLHFHILGGRPMGWPPG